MGVTLTETREGLIAPPVFFLKARSMGMTIRQAREQIRGREHKYLTDQKDIQALRVLSMNNGQIAPKKGITLRQAVEIISRHGVYRYSRDSEVEKAWKTITGAYSAHNRKKRAVGRLTVFTWAQEKCKKPNKSKHVLRRDIVLCIENEFVFSKWLPTTMLTMKELLRILVERGIHIPNDRCEFHSLLNRIRDVEVYNGNKKLEYVWSNDAYTLFNYVQKHLVSI